MGEEWRDIEGYEGYYQVSSFGRFRSLDREVVSKNGRVRMFSGSIRRTVHYSNGYLWLYLCKDGIKKSFIAHRLVAKAFIPCNDPSLEINHKDENKENNSVSNLEWVTHKENINHGTATERRVRNSDFSGVNNPMYGRKRLDHPWSIPINQYDLNGNYIQSFHSVGSAARTLGISDASIHGVLKGKRKCACGYIWEYKQLTEN